jgi:hypothetical protein
VKYEANIASFKILIDERGNLVTEISGLPLSEISNIFSGEEAILIKKIVSESRIKFTKLHNYLENELAALQ